MPETKEQVSTPNGLFGLCRSTADVPNMGESADTGGGLTLVMARGPSSTFPGHAHTSRVDLGPIQGARLGFSSVLIEERFLAMKNIFVQQGKVLFSENSAVF